MIDIVVTVLRFLLIKGMGHTGIGIALAAGFFIIRVMVARSSVR
jgi:hypothetical protein